MLTNSLNNGWIIKLGKLMKIGYKEEDYQIYMSQIKNGIYLKENVLYIITLEEFREFIDIRDIINELDVGDSLKGVFIYGNQ